MEDKAPRTVSHEELNEGLHVRLHDDPSREVLTVRSVTQTSAILEDSSGGRLAAFARELEIVTSPHEVANSRLTAKKVCRHSSDADCSGHVDEDTSTCSACGVLHGDPCPRCGGRGYHADDCGNCG
jgi:hypothetical protein